MPRSRGVSAASAALVVILSSPAASFAQDAVIQGTVLSGTQSPVRGAFVTIEAVGATGVTNDNGRYRLIVPAARSEGQQVTLSVSSIGYRDTSVQITLRPGATIEQDFTMAEQAISLDEVLVTGTAGNRERRAQPAVISTVNAARIAEVAPVQSVANLLQARTPGVVLRNESGTDGTASQIRIRGVSSVELSNDPLIFIDGVRMNGESDNVFNVGGQERSFLNDIKIEEIESIEVVKGPAAATLYGSDANAGVINIITKRGRAQSGFVHSFTVEYGGEDPNFTPPTNYGECNEEAFEEPEIFTACQGQAVGTVLTDNPLVRESSFKDGRRRNLVWSLRGGGEQYAAFFSLGVDDSRGTLENNRYGHISGRANFDYFVNDDLRMEFGLGLNRTNTQLPRNDNDIYGYLGGGLLGDPRTVGAAKDGWYANRQTRAISSYENVNRTMRIQPRVSIQYTPISWFSNRLTFGGDLIRTRAFSFWAKNDDGWWDDAPRNTGRIGEASRSEDRLTFDYLGNITSNLTSELRADLSFGSQVITEHTYQTEAEGTGLITNDVRSVDAAAELTDGGQFSREARQVGLFAQAQFGWRDRLFLQFGGRVDQQSTFGAESKPFYSPKVGVSYVISDESFFRELVGENVISALRLRGAYGVTGRAPSSGAHSTFEPSSYQITETDVAVGVEPDTTGNPELRAEKGQELELGFEVGLFQDRLGLEVTYFNKKTVDAILELPIPGSLGSSSPLINMGSLLNRGFEIAANARVLTYDNVSLELFGTLNTLHNELLDLGDAPPTATMREGFPLEGQWDYTIREVDLENDRVIVSDTLEFQGNGLELPGYEGTFSGTLTLFRNLSFYAQADFRGDVMVFNSTDEFRDRDFGIGGLAVLGCEFIDIDASGECTDAARIQYMRKFGPWVTEEGRELSRTTVDGDYSEDGSFMRLREVSVTYRMPTSFLQRYLRAESASLTFAMRNLKTWMSYTGLDPETDQFLTVPQDRRWTLRFNITF